MADNSSLPTYLIFITFTMNLLCLTIKSQPLSCPLPPGLADRLHTDPAAIESASTDYGEIVHKKPAAVLYPFTVEDIQNLVKSSNNCSDPFTISAHGNGHCVHGQNMALNGVVVDMKHLKENPNGTGIRVSTSPNNFYADVGGEQLWIDVLNATVVQGVLPVSWTDFLELTVGGTLSNAGISGQTFRFGPQISNVLELDVVTGQGEIVTCSANNNADLFYAVLGGFGQFGIITRARIALGPAPKQVTWVKALYNDFSAFTKDVEFIISQSHAVDYLEGELLLDNGTPNAWTTSFFPSTDLPKIMSLVKQYGIIYVLEITKNLKEDGATDKELEKLIKGLGFTPGFIAQKVAPYTEFLTRVKIGGEIGKAHPWLNLFIPKSQISDFNSGVLSDIVLKTNITTAPALLYPMNRNKWDARMSATIPDEDVFYTAGFLYSAGVNDWQVYEDQNKAILQFCDKAGIKIKQYLPNYTTEEEWINHFGSKWTTFQKRKTQFDPKLILSPGQNIFKA